MAGRRIGEQQGEQALRDYFATPDDVLGDRDRLALAVRYSLQLLSDKAPGASVEVRVPPFAACQVIEGPRHTRGTPPAVVETTAGVWLDLVLGHVDYERSLDSGLVQASGLRADLQEYLPLRTLG